MVGITKLKYFGTVIIHDPTSNNSLAVDVEAYADHWYQPCIMYFPDGSGQPEDEDFDITSFTINSIYDEDTDEYLTEKYENDDTIRELVQDALYDMDRSNWDLVNPPEDYKED